MSETVALVLLITGMALTVAGLVGAIAALAGVSFWHALGYAVLIFVVVLALLLYAQFRWDDETPNSKGF